jgi:hypothetical protein
MDSLMQHAIFLADSAERFLDATNHLHQMQGEDGENHDPDAICDAELSHSQAFDNLRSAIYEFRKRLKP